MQEGGEEEDDRHREEQAIHAVEDTTVAGNDSAAILHIGHALEQRLRQIAEIATTPA